MDKRDRATPLFCTVGVATTYWRHYCSLGRPAIDQAAGGTCGVTSGIHNWERRVSIQSGKHSQTPRTGWLRIDVGGPQLPTFAWRPGTPHWHHNHTTLHYHTTTTSHFFSRGCSVVVVCLVFGRRSALVGHRKHRLMYRVITGTTQASAVANEPTRRNRVVYRAWRSL